MGNPRRLENKPAPSSPRGRPRKFSDEQLVDAALKVMGRSGYRALTIRALAEELGVTHSALYTYVGAIEEIEDKAKHRLTDQLPRPQSATAPELRKELLTYLLSARTLLLLHPGVVLSRPGSAASEIFRQVSEQWNRALLPHAPDFKTLQLALAALMGMVLLFVEGERVLWAGGDPKRQQEAKQKASFAGTLQPLHVEQYLSDLMDLVLPGLSARKASRKPAARRRAK